MKPLLPVVLFLLGAYTTTTAQNNLKSKIISQKGEPLAYATVALLFPADSTMASFGISNGEGDVEIKNIKPGNYILQCAYMGYKPYYRSIEIPVPGGPEIAAIVMEPDTRNLKEVEISAEKVPLMIKGDTIEYNSGAYKTKPDASVEELLKKLPGVEVDRAGNIKAQGENVQKVLVDGKEFFGNDPKIATKNLPADAVKKVQVYDKKSDQSEFTGIDDGIRDKTINLQLKDEKKNGYFGDVLAGGGTDEHYRASAKLYRFKPKSQFAALGMANNVNEFGFSVQDYISFKGGMRGLMDGSSDGRLMIGGNNSLPVNFGQPVTGLINSGAGGLNYSYEPVKNNRFNFSYLGNGSKKDLKENSFSRNFTQTSSFTREQDVDEQSKDKAHRINLNWRNDLDSSQQFTMSGSADLNDSYTSRSSVSSSMVENAVLNKLESNTSDYAEGLAATGRMSYLKKFKGKWPVFRIGADVSTNQTLSKTTWSNITTLFGTGQQIFMQQYQNTGQDKLRYSGNSSLTRKLGNGYLLEADVNAGSDHDDFVRRQGVPPGENVIDSLKVDFIKDYMWLRPGLSFKRNTEKIKFNVGLRFENGHLNSGFRDSALVTSDLQFWLPRASWENDYSTGKRIGLRYDTRINTPGVSQLQPVVNNTNPLQLFRGNQYLRPEYIHTLNANWLWYDQFSFTSLFVNASGTYTKDKINTSRNINNNLAQEVTFVNVADDYRADGNIEFSTPVRKLGIGINVSFGESYNKGRNFVNNIENQNSTLSHEFELRFDNRKKEKLDVSAGGSIRYSEARYSVQQSLNNNYYNLSYFADLTWTPTDKWSMTINADVSRYNSKSFKQSVNIPLLKAQVSRYILKANRGVFTLEAFDLLNRNTGLQRISELNYLMETRSNIIGRYFLLSFKYKLNKLSGAEKGNIDIKIRN